MIHVELEGLSVWVEVLFANNGLEADISAVNQAFNLVLRLGRAVRVEDDGNWEAKIRLELNFSLSNELKAIKESILTSFIGVIIREKMAVRARCSCSSSLLLLLLRNRGSHQLFILETVPFGLGFDR